jgi:hypothetical protein
MSSREREEYSKPGWNRAAAGCTVAEHGHERTDARPAGHQKQGTSNRHIPREVPADRSAQLELVARAQLAGQVRGHLAIGDALDGQRQPLTDVRRGRDRIAALRLVAVVGGQTNIHMLAGSVPRPARHVQDDAANAWGLVDELSDVAKAPAQSPL